ncbi:ATP-binding cassette domain-containing protein [Dickeya aquatica]|nr:ATP-binding cassette domain-containing protein [Dickeya aquatica]
MTKAEPLLLEVENLCIYSDVPDAAPLVSGLSFTMQRERVALVGESGAGKSLLACALMGLLPVSCRMQADRLALAGQDVMQLTPRQWRQWRGRRIAMVMQGPKQALNPMRTIGWQVEEPLRLHTSLSRRERRERVLEGLNAVGLTGSGDVLQCYPHQISGGMAQRAMLAMAMITRPDLLIIDERTFALDRETRVQVLSLLDHLLHEHRMGLLLISHDLPLVMHHCTRIMVMQRGQWVDELPASQLPQATHPYTQALWQSRPGGIPAGNRSARNRKRRGMSNAMAVVVQQLCVAYGEQRGRHQVIEDASFSLAQGACLGIAGESGSGKSSLLWTLAGLNAYWSGVMTLLGCRIVPGKPFGSALRCQVQMVFQEPYASLHPRHSVYKTLCEPLRRLGEQGINGQIARLADPLGLPLSLLTRYPHQLSAGQCQRVALLRALLLRPKLLLLDEATSALDTLRQAQVLNLLNVQREQEGLTIILVSHDCHVVHHMCDQLIWLKNGRVQRL